MDVELSQEFLSFHTFWNTNSKEANKYKSLKDVKSLMFQVHK
jgi:hypothetical protein